MVTLTELSGLRRTLKRRFGFSSLREGQEEVIRSVMDRQDTLAIMPTGAGKSLCYQLPALHLPGTTVVVSPLISLMKDQVDKLHELDIPAVQVNSSLTTAERADAIEDIARERSEFVFATPERLTDPEFLATLRRNQIDVFVIDEAHCISQWGHDFRPAFLSLKDALEALGRPPVLALTATATEEVIEDIVEHLDLRDPVVIDTGVFRDNLRFEVVPVTSDADKREHLSRLLGEIGGMGIVYVATVKHCEEVAHYLGRLGHEVARYHGRMGSRERKASQDRFMAGELQAIVATNAFGMGIDKPDIRFVVHYDMPGSLESYYQEAGRAGRDGESARCVLFYLPEDLRTQQYFIRGRYPKPEHFTAVHRVLKRLTDGGGNPPGASFDQIVGQSGAPKGKAQVVLTALKDLGAVEEPEAGHFALVRPLEADELEAVARQYAQKTAGDKERLQRIVKYAQTALCRWRSLLDYFGEDLGRERCGNCDSCSRPLPKPAEPPATRKREQLELLPLLGERRPGDLHEGDVVSLPIYGRGEIREVGGDRLVVALSDGELKEFRTA